MISIVVVLFVVFLLLNDVIFDVLKDIECWIEAEIAFL